MLGLGALLLAFAFWLLQARAGAAREAEGRRWQRDLPKALELGRELHKPVHVHFTSKRAPLAARMDETLALEPVKQLAEARFVSVRLDADADTKLFARLVGSAGVLASSIVDPEAAGEPDVVAVAPGYVDPERYLAFLDGAAQNLDRLRRLRDGKPPQPTALLVLGELYAAQGSVARARSSFVAVKDDAQRPAALEHLARLDVEAGFTAQARRELEQARELGATASPRWTLTEALVLSSERRVSDAIALLSAKLPANEAPDERARCLLLLGQLEHELKRDAEALGYLEKVRSDLPGSSFARAADERIFHIRNPEPGHTH